jgi:hypothetical protein
LAVPGLKYASDGHDLPPGYIYSNVYTLASSNSRALGRAEVEKEASNRLAYFSPHLFDDASIYGRGTEDYADYCVTPRFA